MQRHRHQEFICFLNQIEAQVPAGKIIHAIVDLQAAIKRFLAETNVDPKPFTWNADPNEIIAAVRRGRQALDSHH